MHRSSCFKIIQSEAINKRSLHTNFYSCLIMFNLSFWREVCNFEGKVSFGWTFLSFFWPKLLQNCKIFNFCMEMLHFFSLGPANHTLHPFHTPDINNWFHLPNLFLAVDHGVTAERGIFRHDTLIFTVRSIESYLMHKPDVYS